MKPIMILTALSLLLLLANKIAKLIVKHINR